MNKNTIYSFESLSIILYGMRNISEYEIISNGSTSKISFYVYGYIDKSDRKPELIAECETETIIKLLNEMKISSWDGFHGKHPRGVSDGTMFKFVAVVNEGKQICADGSMSFPKHFREFNSELDRILKIK